MVMTFLSDSHEKHHSFTNQLPGGDVIIHAGDITKYGYERTVVDFLSWYSKTPYQHKIFIAGNHDYFFEREQQSAKDLLAKYPSIIYLEESGIEIDGVKFWGSPYSPRFFDWAFNEDRGKKIRDKWMKIPHDTNVLITHAPPHGVHDYEVAGHKHVGCWDLFDVVTGVVRPKYHIFGHIHEGFGMTTIGATTFINASLLNRNYDEVNSPITVTY
jgi:Icc-related predicted phosphoesterase